MQCTYFTVIFGVGLRFFNFTAGVLTSSVLSMFAGHAVFLECAIDRGFVGRVGQKAVPHSDRHLHLCPHPTYASQCLASLQFSKL
jgi:hypothetical protein